MKATTHKLTLAGFIITFIGSVLFSTKAVIVKKAFADIKIDALTLLALRMLFALPFYLVIIAVIKSASNDRFTTRQWLQVIVVGLFGYYISSFLDFEGLQYITAGLERLILFLYPTFVVLINRIYFKQAINRIQAVALLLTYSGILLAYAGDFSANSLQPGFLWGCLLVFLCSITYAIYIVGSGKLIPVVGATKFTAYAMLAATGGILLHYFIKNGAGSISGAVTMHWQYGLLLAVVATVLPSFMIGAGMKRIGSNNVAIVSGVGPVATMLQAHWLLGERITGIQVAGTVLVIAGVLILGLKKEKVAQEN